MLENGKRKGSAMNIEIAQRLYELRRAHGFSQESLAAALGLSRQAISKWERSESAPDMGNLIALADLYGMTIDELIRPAAQVVEEDGEGPDAEAVGAPEGTEAAEAAEAPVREGAQQSVQPEQPAREIPQPQQEGAEDTKQVQAHGHVYTRPTATGHPRCALRRFPFPLLVIVLVLVLALVFGLWEYIWLVLTIPFYYWTARVIERDPIFLEQHGYAASGNAAHDAQPVPGNAAGIDAASASASAANVPSSPSYKESL